MSQICFRQDQRVDYDETFSLVAMLKVCWNYVSSCCIIYEILHVGCQNIVFSTVSLRKHCMWYNQKVLSILKILASMQAPAILKWTGASISELEYTLWWDDQRFWVCTRFMRNLYFQRSEWEHYRISDKYMWLTYCGSEVM